MAYKQLLILDANRQGLERREGIDRAIWPTPETARLTVILFVDLRSEVVANVADVQLITILFAGALNSVLDHQRHVRRQRQVHLRRQRRSLGEVVQVFHGERQADRLGHRDRHSLFWFVLARGLVQGHLAAAQIALCHERNALLGDRDGDRIGDLRQITADALEFAGRHRDVHAVAGLLQNEKKASG